MSLDQRISLQEVRSQLKDISEKFQDPFIEMQIVPELLGNLNDIQTSLKDLASSMESDLSEATQKFIEENAAEIDRIDGNMDTYKEQQEEDLPFENEIES